MSCFNVSNEQLYLLEVKVDSLNLTQEKLYECDKRQLNIKIKFLDLPLFILTKTNMELTENSIIDNDEKNGKIFYSSGISCLFSKKPRDLVNEISKKSMRIGIFCIDETYPIAETTLQLSGCMCDQMTMAMNDKNHLPIPFSQFGTYNLIDPGENLSGYIDIEIKITCLGKYVTTHYQIKDNSFIFKNEGETGEYCVKRVLPNDEKSKIHENSIKNDDNDAIHDEK